ncbi:MAG: OmpA family protein [Bacteroidetes bacterium]|nr:OmpA family protein [Bacteroidota bacterium]
MKIRLSGHTDSDGEDGYNLKLSESRARAVMDYLISQAIDAKRINSAGMGNQGHAAPMTRTKAKP